MKNFLRVISDTWNKIGKKADTLLTVLQALPWMRYFKIFACGTLLVLVVFYAAASMFYNEGGLSISLRDEKGRLDKSGQLSLSETPDFEDPVVQLRADSLGSLTNVSGLDLPDNIEAVESEELKEGFIIYTFYVKNSGNADCNVKTTLHIDSVVKGVDEAIRVRLYKDGAAATYAKLSKNGVPEYGTTPFWDDVTVFNDTIENLAVGENVKYTVVIWLEGDDPECLDNIRGGNLKMSLTLTVEDEDDST